MTFAWPSVNSNELQEKNSTFPTGSLSFQEVSYVISIANIGSVIGNFAVVPVATIIGPKLTIHLLCIPIIVIQISTVRIHILKYSLNKCIFRRVPC